MHPKLDMMKCLIAAVAVFVLASVYAYVVRHLIITTAFPEYSTIFPTPENIWTLRLWNYLGRAIFAAAFTVIFAKGYEGKPGIGEGLRFGLLMGFLRDVPMMFNTFVATTTPAYPVISFMVLGVLEMVLCGIVAALLYRPAAKPAA